MQCNRCGSTEIRESKLSEKLSAWCRDCNNWIAYINEPIMVTFGKYKYELVEDAVRNDPKYFNYILEQDFEINTMVKDEIYRCLKEINW